METSGGDMRVCSLQSFVLMTMGLLSASSTLAEKVFVPADIIEWEAHSFLGHTQYSLIEVDGREAVHAVCDEGTASGLFLRQEIDLNETPILEWEWRVDSTFQGIDESTREGDDYPARLYAVDEHRIARWRTRALNYVWASEKAQGSHWPNAYQFRAMMIAVRSGSPSQPGQWKTERRDLQADFKKYHDRDVDSIDALAVMSDCDDTGEQAEAWYGEIRLLPRPQDN